MAWGEIQMVDFSLFMVFSVLETTAMFFLIFRMFKIDIFFKEILFAGAIMAFVSFVLRNDYGFVYVDILLQFLLMFLFMWLIIRIHLLYAVILTGVAYQCYLLIQSVYLIIMSQFGLFESTIPYITETSTYILQTISAVSVFILASYIKKKRTGFDFVPDSPRRKIPMHLKSRDLHLFLLTLPSPIIFIITLHMVETLSSYYLAIPVIYVLFLFCFLFVSYKKDWEDANRNDL
ncbi:hypothetical protein IDH44_07495 [Paenibacillus sp. IB182496]|uniref:Uncharacterized protein n=1 Tax=Paenibacillus sabuli TaxID=2772509 RepID=A0A927BSM6_9BACL|nr:hypothetical protein [Paenibacillus sabuli]MBD2845030.1 hypothetical protein [Paenibacillus sabuli]